jgi:hypothetical protein
MKHGPNKTLPQEAEYLDKKALPCVCGSKGHYWVLEEWHNKLTWKKVHHAL